MRKYTEYITFLSLLYHWVHFPNLFNEFLENFCVVALAIPSQILGSISMSFILNSIHAQSSAQWSPLELNGICMNTRDKTNKVVRRIYCQVRFMGALCSLHNFLVFNSLLSNKNWIQDSSSPRSWTRSDLLLNLVMFKFHRNVCTGNSQTCGVG